MAAANANLTKDIPYILEQLFLGKNTGPGVQSVTISAALPVAIPSVTGGVANTSTSASVVVAVTGAKVGDYVWTTPLTALPTNCTFAGAYVATAGNVTFVFTSSVAGAIVGATVNFDTSIVHRS